MRPGGWCVTIDNQVIKRHGALQFSQRRRFIRGSDDHAGTAIIDDVAHFARRQHYIDRIDDAAGFQHGVIGDNPFPAVDRI